MFTGQHLDDNASNTPDVGLRGVAALLDDLWCHPENRALERYTITATASFERSTVSFGQCTK